MEVATCYLYEWWKMGAGKNEEEGELVLCFCNYVGRSLFFLQIERVLHAATCTEDSRLQEVLDDENSAGS